jgi:hypothetical protein
MKYKCLINRLTLAFASMLLSAVLLSSCDSSIDNSRGVRVDYITSYGKDKFKYHCSQFDGFGTKSVIILDDVNKYNVGDTLWIVCKHCR